MDRQTSQLQAKCESLSAELAETVEKLVKETSLHKDKVVNNSRTISVLWLLLLLFLLLLFFVVVARR